MHVPVRSLSHALTLVVACCWLAPMSALAQEDGPPTVSPAELARRCIHHTQTVADRTAKANANTAKHAVHVIQRLLEADHPRKAKDAAKAAVDRIEKRSDVSVSHIKRDCAKCVAALHRLGAHRLAATVRDACEEAVTQVRRSQALATKAIRSQFGNATEAD